MIMTMPKKKVAPGSTPTDGRAARYKPISSGKLTIWADEFEEFAANLRSACELIRRNEVASVSFDGGAGFDEVVSRIRRALDEANSDIKETIRKNRLAKA